MAPVLDHLFHDLRHLFLHDDVIAVDQGDRGVGILLDAADELSVDDERLSVERVSDLLAS